MATLKTDTRQIRTDTLVGGTGQLVSLDATNLEDGTMVFTNLTAQEARDLAQHLNANAALVEQAVAEANRIKVGDRIIDNEGQEGVVLGLDPDGYGVLMELSVVDYRPFDSVTKI